jgi:hypothetical protein
MAPACFKKSLRRHRFRRIPSMNFGSETGHHCHRWPDQSTVLNFEDSAGHVPTSRSTLQRRPSPRSQVHILGHSPKQRVALQGLLSSLS